MEIALVYREIQQLLVKDENVMLPKVGKFAIVAKPATFLEDCKTILPPKKELLFSMLSEQEENVTCEPWQQELGEEISSRLQLDGTFEVPGFGIFRQNDGGEVSFEVSPEFDFAPDSFSLEAISLELNPAPVPEPDPEPVPEPEPELVPGAQDGPAVPQPEPESATGNSKVLMWVIVSVAAVLLVILFIFLFREQFVQMLKNLLYTDEELEIIRQWGAR